MNLLSLGGLISALEINEDIEVLLRREQVKQDVVLRAYSHRLTHQFLLFEQIIAK